MFELARPEGICQQTGTEGAWVTMRIELSCWSPVTQWPQTVPRKPGWLSLWSGVLALRSLLPGLQTTMAPRSRALALRWGEGRSWPGSCLLWAHLSQPGPRPPVCTSTPHPPTPLVWASGQELGMEPIVLWLLLCFPDPAAAGAGAGMGSVRTGLMVPGCPFLLVPPDLLPLGALLLTLGTE